MIIRIIQGFLVVIFSIQVTGPNYSDNKGSTSYQHHFLELKGINVISVNHLTKSYNVVACSWTSNCSSRVLPSVIVNSQIRLPYTGMDTKIVHKFALAE